MQEKIIDKLQKLIAHSQSAKQVGNLAEAEAFAGKIQELLTKHQLSMSDVDIEQEEAKQEEAEKQYVYGEKWTSRQTQWQIILFRGICRANDCINLVVPGSNTQAVVGLTEDRQTVIALYAYFVRLAKGLCDVEFKAYKQTDEYEEDIRWENPAGFGRTWKRSWCEGFAYAIMNRLYTARKAAEGQAEQIASQSNALVHLRNKQAIVDRYYKAQKFGKYRGGGTGNTNGDAYGAGSNAGNSVALTSNTLNG